MECAASLLLQLMAAPLPDTRETKEGKAAHWHAMKYAQNHILPVGAKFKHDGEEWEVDADMFNGSKLYAYHTVASGRFEDPVGMPQIHEQCWGTPDYFNLQLHYQTRAPERLYVKDYKYGHRYVDAWRNWQLIAYAIGVINRLSLLDDPNFPVTLVIIQPRCYRREGPVKEWNTTVGELFRYAMEIKRQVDIAMAPGAPATTGPHCMDCAARHLCTTLQRGAMHVVQFAHMADAADLPLEALGTEARLLLEAQQVVNARLEGLKAQIEALLRGGKAVPYWMLDDGRSMLKWNEGVGLPDVQALEAATGLTLTNPPKPFTPTQCKDAGVDEAVIKLYATRQPAGKVLKPDSTTTARKVFSKV